MNQKRLMILLPAALLIAGLTVWLVINSGEASPATEISQATHDNTELEIDQPLTEDAEAAKAPDSDNSGPLTMTEADVEASRTSDKPELAAGEGKRTSDNGEASDSTSNGQPTGGTDRNGRAPTGGSSDTPKRKLTRAEQEEERRRTTGRPALQKRLARTPAGSVAGTTTKKSIEQKKWEEEWYAEGFNPPEMTPTPVRGKIMSEQAREGLASAIVGLISFFPLDGVAGGKLLPVITELETDEDGFFSGEIPASKLAPLNYPPVALAITWESHRIVTASPVETLVVGQQNELGIFWAPEIPYQLRVDATQFDNAISVVTTGQLDPQRWHPAKLGETLQYFPTAMIAQEVIEGGPPAGHADLIATWDGGTTPYVTLINSDSNQTRRPKHATVISTTSGGVPPAPFDVLVFENDAFTPISGQVVDTDGAAIANAVLTTVGDAVSQSVLSDAAGWFYFENPPEQTHSLHCIHDDFVETTAAPVKPGDSDVTITLETARPRIPMYVIDRVTQAPITELSIKIIGLHASGESAGQPMPEAFTELSSSDGHYLLEWEFEIQSMTLEKIGYFPRTLQAPVALLEQSEGALNIELTPGRKLEVNPRDYTGVQNQSRWFPDSEPTSPGIYTAWANHWIEYEIDFGEAPEEGEEGGSFDILLGCTNHGIVDNEYQFKVDVYVDGAKKGTLTIMADSLHPQTGRMSLGELSGTHTIRLIWTNDKWIPEQLDANIRYDSLKFLEQP